MDDDFVSSDNYQEHPHDTDDLNASRLSDVSTSINTCTSVYNLVQCTLFMQDYDWRQYASLTEGSHIDDQLSLRTRLAGKSAAVQQSTSVDVDNSLSGSTSIVSHDMTLL